MSKKNTTKNINSGKKNDERESLLAAIRALGKKKGNASLVRLLGKELDNGQSNTERPDFIRAGTFHGKEATVGVEVFKVFQQSRPHINHAPGRYPRRLDTGGGYTENANAVMFPMLMDRALQSHRGQKDVAYDNFMGSFRHSLDRHVKAVPHYLKHIKDVAHGRQTKLVLLVRFLVDFDSLILSDGRRDFFPIFDDLVKELERVQRMNTGINYIILYATKQFPAKKKYTGPEKVIVLDMCSGVSVRDQLRDQGQSTYLYAGVSFLQPTPYIKDTGQKPQQKKRPKTKDDKVFNDLFIASFEKGMRTLFDCFFSPKKKYAVHPALYSFFMGTLCFWSERTREASTRNFKSFLKKCIEEFSRYTYTSNSTPSGASRERSPVGEKTKNQKQKKEVLDYE